MEGEQKVSEFSFRVKVTDSGGDYVYHHIAAGSMADALRKVATAGDVGLLGQSVPDEVKVEREHELGFPDEVPR